MNPGDVCYLDYGEVPQVYHVRLLGCLVDRELWAIVTPDGDIYDEEMSPNNPDLISFTYGGAGLGAGIPPGVDPARVYGFGPITAVEFQQYMAQCRVYAAGVRASMGLPAVPVVAAAPAAGAAPAVPPGAQAVEMVWVSLENFGTKVQGQVVVAAGQGLPPGHVTVGDRAIVPEGGGFISLKRVKFEEVSTLAVRDLRVLPIKFDAHGERRRDFSEAVAMMTQDKLPGGGLQLDGPCTTLEVLKSLSARNLTPITDHERWIRSSEIAKTDRSIFEMEVLAKIMEAFVMTDQINLPNTKGGELILRRWQLIKEAHRISPMAPDYSSSDYFMGWQMDLGVNQSLAKHVSDQLRDQAAIAKEARKAKEEIEHRRGRGGRGRGRGGRDPGASASAS